MKTNPQPVAAPIEDILAHPKQKSFRDLRDRAAYIFITGCFPTHLRPEANELLRLLSSLSQGPTSLDGRSGSLLIMEEAAMRLDLRAHAMTRKVREYLDKGYRIADSRGSKSRRPYSKIFLFRRDAGKEERIIVQSDGSVLDRW